MRLIVLPFKFAAITQRLTCRNNMMRAARQSVLRVPRGAFAILGLIAVVATSVILSGSDARADVPPACGARSEVLALLAEQYKEAPVGIGLANGGNLIELLTSAAGSTWTLIITTPKGATCILAAGEDWEVGKSAAFSGQGI